MFALYSNLMVMVQQATEPAITRIVFKGVHMKTMLTFTSLAVVGMLATGAGAGAAAKDMVDTAVAAGSFKTLAQGSNRG